MSDYEKKSSNEASSTSEFDRLIDPDAGKSPEERASAVRDPWTPEFWSLLTTFQERKLLWKLDMALMPWVRMVMGWSQELVINLI